MSGKVCTVVYLLLVLQTPANEAARILGITAYPTPSHEIFFNSIYRALLQRGHELTVISSENFKDPSLVNLTEIDTSSTKNLLKTANIVVNQPANGFLFQKILWGQKIMEILVEAQLQFGEVQKLIEDENEHFDLIVLEGLFPLIFAWGYRFKAPVISISTLSAFIHCHDIMGNPTHPIYPDTLMTGIENYSFTYRFSSFMYNIWYRALFHWYILPREDKIARKYFGNDMPYLGDIFMNTSMLMVNVNPIISIPRANVPNVIELSQVHIREKQPLPKDIQDFLDSSENGVVYFSLGTNIDTSYINPRIAEITIQAFSELPYNVIWKNEVDNFPNKPDNVLIKKWLPQQDILGHKKLRVFVTQGGLQSIEEALHNEIPMVGIPFIVDQPLNIKSLSDKGMAVGLNFETMTKDDLKKAIIEVAENNRYKEKIREAAKILKDQPLKGVDKAVYWIEYVIRHKGAKHLRSPAADMPYYKYFMVDVISILVCVFFVFVIVIRKVCKMIRHEERNNKVKKN